MPNNKQDTPHRQDRIRDLMKRVELIDSQLPAKRINAKGKSMDYNSKVYRHLEAMVGIARELNDRKPYPIIELQEQVRSLKGTLKILRESHKGVKANNAELRRQLK